MNKMLLELLKNGAGVSINSREVKKNDIFFGIRGANFNGNKFAKQALENGAQLAVVDDFNAFEENNRYQLVENTLESLQKLARAYRDSLCATVIGITGTNGKTTTKELMFKVLSEKFESFCTQGNLNNHIGVPLSILSIKQDTEFAIIEMGANHQGEIMELCNIANPDFGLITNIGKAHLEGFGSRDIILKTKSELFNYVLNKGGTCFLNSDDELLRKSFSKSKVFTYGKSGENKINGNLNENSFPLNVSLFIEKERFFIQSQLFGDYNLSNILAAAAVGFYFGVDPHKITRAIESYFPSNNRSQLIKSGDRIVIMDAYNANPTSMKVALESLAKLKTDKKFFVLGDMLELGKDSEKEHLEIINLLKILNLTKGILVGKEFKNVAKDYKVVESVEELKSEIKELELSHYTILIKGSRRLGLEKVLEMI